MKPLYIFKAALSGRYYATRSVKQLSHMHMVCTGKKEDVTEQIEALIAAARPDEGDSLREAVGNDAIYKPQRPWLKLPENENWPPKRACSAKEAVYWYLDWVKRHTQETAEQGITGPEWALKHGDPYQVLEHLIDDMMRLATTSALAVKDGGHA